MRLYRILALIAVLAAPAQAAGRVDPVLDQALEAPPEIEVRVPSDRTDFSPPPLPAPDAPVVEIAGPALAAETPADIGPPDLPEVAVVIPEASPESRVVVAEPPPAVVATPAAPPPATVPDPVTPPASAPVTAQTPPAADRSVRFAAALDAVAPLAPVPASGMRSLRDFYEKRDFRPLFTDGAALNDRARRALAVIAAAADHGLDPRRFARLNDMLARPEAEMREAALAALAFAYARDARGGRLNPQAVARLITATPTLPEAGEVLERLAEAVDAGAALEGWNPQHRGYRALKASLAAARANEAETTASVRPVLSFGQTLRVGMSDARVPLLRALLSLPAAPDPIYDDALSQAVRAAQRQHGLKPTGRLDRRIVAALGGQEAEGTTGGSRVADIVANMERWRWLPADLGAAHVFVNVPAYRLEMKREGEIAFETRVIVGKPATPTPIFSHRMEYLVVNPSWNVPPSIATKEYLPLLRANPYALQARGLEIVSRGRVVDPATADWSKIGRSVAIRQPPGERNALGHIKFMFPNEHAVYLHDTPSRGLFSAERRAFSHGCVRVQNPFALASAVTGWNEGRLRGMVGGGERRLDLAADVDVHIAYLTLEAKADGSLMAHEDIYGHHRRTKALLGL